MMAGSEPGSSTGNLTSSNCRYFMPAALREAIEPLHIPGAGIRIASELGWITAELRPIDE